MFSLAVFGLALFFENNIFVISRYIPFFSGHGFEVI